jgi:hypothetical protein
LFQKTRDEFLGWAAAEHQNGPAADLRPTIAALALLAKLLLVFPTLSEPYLEQTAAYYQDKADGFAADVEAGLMSPTRYVEWVLEKSVEEQARAENWLDASVATEAVKVVRREAGEKLSKRVVRKGKLRRNIADRSAR